MQLTNGDLACILVAIAMMTTCVILDCDINFRITHGMHDERSLFRL